MNEFKKNAAAVGKEVSRSVIFGLKCAAVLAPTVLVFALAHRIAGK